MSYKILSIKDIKTNKKDLLEFDELKTIYEAKKKFNVKTADEAYIILLNKYNDTINAINRNNEERERIKQERKQKRQERRRHVSNPFAEMDDDLFQSRPARVRAPQQRPFEVLIEVKEKVTYERYMTNLNRENRTYVYFTDNTITHTFTLNDATQVDNAVRQLLTEKYPFEDSYKSVEMENYKYTVNRRIKRRSDIMDVPMRKAFPFKTSFLKHFESIKPICYENHNGECVLKILQDHLKVTEKFLKNIFNEASLKLYDRQYKKKNGITSRMIEYLCKQKNISCLGFDQNEFKFIKHVQDKHKAKKYKAIIYYCVLNHFYLIEDEDTIRSITQHFKNGCDIKRPNTLILEKETENNNTFISGEQFIINNEDDDIIEDEDKEVSYEYKPVYDIEVILNQPKYTNIIFNQSKLNDILVQYIREKNDIPKVKFSNHTSVNKISLPNNINLLTNGNTCENIDWNIINEICVKCEIPFNNQSIGTLLMDLKDKFFKKERVRFSAEFRESIKQNQNNKCNECDCVLNKHYEIDHIIPLANNGTNEINNLQALCKSCHLDKNSEEREGCEYIKQDTYMSNFNIQANKVIQSNHFRKVAFTEMVISKDDKYFYKNDMDYKAYSIDINKCRKNLLVNSNYDFCKYSVLDNITYFDGNVTDGFYYIETDNTFPLRKNGFYSKPMVEYCLAQGIIAMENIKYQFKSSFTINSKHFNEFVNYLVNDVFVDYPHLQKLSVNSLVGLFGRRNNTYIEHHIRHKNSNLDIDQIANNIHINKYGFMVDITDDIVAMTSENEIQTLSSAFPIHAQILDMEAIELHKMINIIKENNGVPVYVKTDCVGYLSKNKIDFNNYYWDTEETVKKYKDEIYKEPVKEVKIKNENKYILQATTYNTIEENDDFDTLTETVYNMNKSILVIGPAGSGKTTFINKLIQKIETEFRLSNKSNYITRLTPTNISALLINGTTLDKFIQRYVHKSDDDDGIEWIIIDEISMVKEVFYQMLLNLKFRRPSLKFIICGEFFQLPPVNDKVNKNPRSTRIYEYSRALFELVDGNKLTLTKCRRSNDTLYNLNEQIKCGVDVNINRFLKNDKTYKNLCYTNEKRKMVNIECMNRFMNEHKYRRKCNIEKLSYDNNSQDYTLVEGMPLIARINRSSLNIYNNETFICNRIENDNIVVVNCLTNKCIDIPKRQFNKLFHLAFCITIHKSQGATYHEKYTIHEWNKSYYTLRYVAMSRATNIENIIIKY